MVFRHRLLLLELFEIVLVSLFRIQRDSRHHLLHHFHNEQGNFGITSLFCDRVFGSLYVSSDGVLLSHTVSNLGYHDQERFQYPWVAQLSEQKP